MKIGKIRVGKTNVVHLIYYKNDAEITKEFICPHKAIKKIVKLKKQKIDFEIKIITQNI